MTGVQTCALPICKVFDFISRKTPVPGARDEGLLKSLFRNLGQKQLFGN